MFVIELPHSLLRTRLTRRWSRCWTRSRQVSPSRGWKLCSRFSNPVNCSYFPMYFPKGRTFFCVIRKRCAPAPPTWCAPARNSWKHRGRRRRSAALHRSTRRSSTAEESISVPPRTGRFVMFANLPKLPADPGGQSARWRRETVKNSNSRCMRHRRCAVPTTCWPSCSSAFGRT